MSNKSDTGDVTLQSAIRELEQAIKVFAESENSAILVFSGFWDGLPPGTRRA